MGPERGALHFGFMPIGSPVPRSATAAAAHMLEIFQIISMQFHHNWSVCLSVKLTENASQKGLIIGY